MHAPQTHYTLQGSIQNAIKYSLSEHRADLSPRQEKTGAYLYEAAVQIGIISAVQWLELSAGTVIKIQTLRLAAAGEMVGALTHELNPPLTALSIYGTAAINPYEMH